MGIMQQYSVMIIFVIIQQHNVIIVECSIIHEVSDL